MWLSDSGSVELVDVSDKLPGLVRENGICSWQVCVCVSTALEVNFNVMQSMNSRFTDFLRATAVPAGTAEFAY